MLVPSHTRDVLQEPSLDLFGHAAFNRTIRTCWVNEKIGFFSVLHSWQILPHYLLQRDLLQPLKLEMRENLKVKNPSRLPMKTTLTPLSTHHLTNKLDIQLNLDAKKELPKSSETANGRSDSGHKQDGKEAQNGESCLELCRLSKRRSDVEKLLETSKVVIDIREDSGDTLIVVDTAVLDIASLERLLGCEAKRGRDVLHCTQENASSDTGKILLSEIRDELRFCETAFDVRRAGAESAFKCYEMTAKACGIYDVWDVWNERAGEENENAEFVA